VSVSADYQIHYNKRGGIRFYGGNREFFYSHDPEVIVSGPAETGKTLAACWKLHLLAMKYPGARLAFARKTQASMYGTVLQTFDRVIKGANIEIYGGNRPEIYTYPNGAQIFIGGLDNPDRLLSSERDVIYVNQAEELKLNDWETMTTRTTGRGAVMPYTQLIGDCNPGGSKHWIRERAKACALKLIPTTHRDNPTLYDPVTGEITAQGKRTMQSLERLTGVRRKRLLEGIWATAEGAVYDMFDPATHVVERSRSEFVRFGFAIDEGYTNPAVILVIGEDSDGRLHIFEEFYKRGVLQSAVVEKTLELNTIYHPYQIVVDAAAAGLIADLRNAGLPAYGAKGRVLDGIQAVQNFMHVAGDGRPRMTIDPGCTYSINDFESYSWKPEKDEPIKENDHAPDGFRYYVISNTSGEREETIIYDERVIISEY
jgi:PBSX family phage terminase large subunit